MAREIQMLGRVLMEKSKLALIGAFALSSFVLAVPVHACGDGGCEPPSNEQPAKGNNGLGNGDQPAPGNSGEHNKAENQAGAPGHASGKAQVPN